MQSTAVPMLVGGVELLVEVTPVAGTQPTSRVNDVTGRVVDAFGRVKEAIVEMAASTVEVIQRTGEQAISPDQLQVQFGLNIAANGSVIVAGVSGAATVTVTLVYDARRPKPAQQAVDAPALSK